MKINYEKDDDQRTINLDFIDVLQLILITLKLCEVGVVANWQWYQVLAPFIVDIIFSIGSMLIALITSIIDSKS